MRLLTRLKYRCLRLLGVVSPSGRYPMPPRWAMSRTPSTQLCEAPCGFCAGVMDRTDPEAGNGRERGSQGFERGSQGFERGSQGFERGAQA